jgi:thioredoxin reductase
MCEIEECVIIGAGPIGLAAAVHMTERGVAPLVLEAGASAGSNIQSWGHVQLFTPWALTLDELSARHLASSGWSYPKLMDIPTGYEFCRDYLIPLSQLPGLKENIRYGIKVIRVSYQENIFHVHTSDGGLVRARALLDCSGTYGNKRSFPLFSAHEANDGRIFTSIPDFTDPATVDSLLGGIVAVVGGGHSALSSVYGLLLLRELKPDVRVLWLLNTHTKETVVQKEKTYFKDVPDGYVVDALHALDHAVQHDLVEVITKFKLTEIAGDQSGVILSSANGQTIHVSSAIINIGFHPDYGIYEYIEEPMNPLTCVEGIYEHIKPSENSCLTVREQELPQLLQETKGHFILGQKSYGNASTFLLKTGYGQVHVVADHLVGSLIGA